MKKLLVVFVAGLALCGAAEVIRDLELVPAMQAAGLDPTAGVTGTSKGGYSVTRLFDGYEITPAANETDYYRWLDKMSGHDYEYGNADGKCSWAQITIPDTFHPGKKFILTKYRLVRTYWHHEGRNPTAWRIVGIRDNGERVVVDEKNVGRERWSDAIYDHDPKESETNLFETASTIISGEGFRTYRIEFLNSIYYEDKADNAYDIGLNEFPLYFDVADEDEGQTYIVTGIDEDGSSYKEGQFLPRDGVWARGGGTITAPAFVNIGNVSYACKGHRIDKLVDGVWVWGTPVLDGANEVAYTPENETDKFRFVWLWEDMNYFVEKATTTWTRYMQAKGFEGNENVSGAHVYGGMENNLFDGITYDHVGGSGVRFLVWIGRGGESDPVYSEVSPPAGSMVAGDEFVCSKYRLYLLNSEREARIPTAWSVKVLNQASGGAFTQVDYHTNYTFACKGSKTVEGRNFDEFAFETPVPFNTFRFTFIDSPEYQTNLAKGTAATASAPDAGLMEVELFGNVANPKGTLRVLSSVADVEQTVFSPVHESTLDGALGHTLKAPTVVTTVDGTKTYGLLGYRIETFNETTLLWEGTGYVADTTGEYAWAANAEHADRRLRFIWVYDRNHGLCKVQATPFDSDVLAAEVSPVGENGYVVQGSTITLTAKPIQDDLSQGDAGNTNRFHSEFVRWAGDIGGLDINVTNSSVSFVLDRPRNIVPMYKEDWLCYEYDKANEGGSGTEWRIKNTVWDLAVTQPDANGKIALVRTAWRGGRGALDLSTKIHHHATGAILKMTSINGGAMYNGSGKTDADKIVYGPVTDLVLPRDLEYLGNASFRNRGTWGSNAKLGWYVLTNVVIDCPNLHTINGDAFTRQFALSKVVVKAPNCTSLGPNYAFYGANFNETNFDDWDLTSATNVPFSWFHGEVDVSLRPAYYSNGTIRFPNARAVGESAFGICVGIAAFEIGTTNGLLSAIDDRAFRDTRATNYVFGCTADMDVNTNAFVNAAAVQSVSFVNYPPKDGVTLNRILWANSASEMAKVYVSRMRDSIWSAYTVPTASIDDDAVKAQAEELGACGAFRNDAGTWKAFIFPQSMPFDPKGTIVILR